VLYSPPIKALTDPPGHHLHATSPTLAAL